VSLQRNPIDFEKIIRDSFAQIQFLDNASQFKLNIKVDNDTSFHSDNRRIEIIFNNIISNAVRYADTAKVFSVLDIDIKITQKQAIILCVDNGIGIAPEHIDKIFNMFYRATDNGSGSGLGLYIVKESVNTLGGSVEISSILGSWTKFKIILPNLKNTLLPREF
jgi:signal transduction histidine kinase